MQFAMAESILGGRWKPRNNRQISWRITCTLQL